MCWRCGETAWLLVLVLAGRSLVTGPWQARQPGSSPVRGHCQGGSRLEHHHLRFIARTNQSPAAATSPPTRGEKLCCLCLAVMVMVGPTPIHYTSTLHHAIMWRPAHGHHRYSTTYYNTIFNLRSLKSEYRFFFTESSSMA